MSLRIYKSQLLIYCSRITGDMSIPTESTNAHVTSKLKEKINENIYSIGELIVSQVFQK